MRRRQAGAVPTQAGDTPTAPIVALLQAARLTAEPDRLQALAEELERLGREIRAMAAVDVTDVAPAPPVPPEAGRHG